VLTPRNESELAEAVAGAKAPLRVIGGGTRPVGVPAAGEDLSTAELRGIRLYEPGALTIVAEAGTPLAEVEAALAAEGQRLPFEPMDHRPLLGTEGEPTIGGVVAANVSGPRRVQAGACRDSLIGVRFVDGTGAVVKNGGRVMKNVTGYDLVKLLAGSHGTLGILSEVSFKVLPETAARAMLVLHGLDASQAVEAMSAALTSPFEVTGAAHGRWNDGSASVTLIRIEGFQASVGYRADRLRNLLARFGDVEVVQDADRIVAAWRGVRDVLPFAGRDGDVWRFSVKPSDAPALVERIGPAECLLDWGGGLVWALAAPGTDLRARLRGMPGHATLIRGSDETKRSLGVFHPEPAPLAAIANGLRRKFDPRGILNHGLMGT
jgi:glycolate oxidase FAD binding subunit